MKKRLLMKLQKLIKKYHTTFNNKTNSSSSGFHSSISDLKYSKLNQEEIIQELNSFSSFIKNHLITIYSKSL